MPNRNQLDKETRVAIKFVLVKIKRLIMDSYGDPRYVKNVDSVIADLFGFKNLASKLNDCYDDHETMVVLSKFTMKNMMAFCDNSRIYAAVAEMVAIDYRISEIRRTFKKLEKKGKKRDKDTIKELEYLEELYKDSAKVLRKKLGQKSGNKSYKRQYSVLGDMVRSKNLYGYEDDDVSVMMSFGDEYDDEDDEDEYGRGKSEFTRYLNKTLGKSSKKKSRTVQSSSRDDYDDEDEDDDESDEDAEQDDIGRVAASVDALTKIVGSMLKTGRQLPLGFNPDVITEANYLGTEEETDEDDDDELPNEFVSRTSKILDYLIDRTETLFDTNGKILSLLEERNSPRAETDAQTPVAHQPTMKPTVEMRTVVQNVPVETIESLMNHHPDFAMVQSEPRAPQVPLDKMSFDKMSRSDLIDYLNMHPPLPNELVQSDHMTDVGKTEPGATEPYAQPVQYNNPDRFPG